MSRRLLIGTRIRERRLALGLKQADVAAGATISPSYLNLIEHNRRGIAGGVLLRIAMVLDLDPSALTEGADSELVRRLEATAPPDGNVELDQVEDFVTRFPGWAAVLADLGDRVQQMRATVEGLSDRLTHDPFLSENLHEMLSSVTAIQATSGILAGPNRLEPLQQKRFQTNIHDEARRLSDLSQAMVRHFDRPPDDAAATSTPQDEMEAFLQRHDYHFAALEGDGRDAVEGLIKLKASDLSTAARTLLRGVLWQYADDAFAMPLAGFLEKARANRFQCVALARAFGVSLSAVFRRLAFLPPKTENADFGLVQCDASGAVLLRKSLPGFPLPRYGAACSLWPLYQALGQPHNACRSILQTGDDMRFLAEAHSHFLGDAGFDMPPVLRSTMLFRPLAQPFASTDETAAPSVLAVGTSCRICPRAACVARREPPIHNVTL